VVEGMEWAYHWRKKQGGWGGCSPPMFWKGPHATVIALTVTFL